jgi:hypothetical protein
MLVENYPQIRERYSGEGNGEGGFYVKKYEKCIKEEVKSEAK